MLRSRDHDASLSVHQADVSDPDLCRALIDEVMGTHGRVDYLVNNAGAVTEQRVTEIGPADWERQIAVNLSAAFHLTQAALVPMIEQRFGRIVNVGSVTAVMGSPVQVAYGAAKAGVLGLSRSIARTVAHKGITVNTVVPGSIETEMAESLRYTKRELVTGLIPMGRWGTPAEVAHAVAFLLDDRSEYMTGSVVTVDGGMSMGA
jgi:acetoacetyl-CoA reductase/3-oxoacyl-[acyl-carrier protein] reductase